MFSNQIAVRGNTVRSSSVGANIMDSRLIEVVGNRFERNRGVSAVGLTLKQCDDSRVSGNVLIDNLRGLQVDGSSGNEFTGNRFLYNDTGIALFSSAERNTFSNNRFDGNWSDVIVSGGTAAAAWSVGGRGNSWSGYRGFDFDGDGIGDIPHLLVTPFAAIEGGNPTARLFLRTPAASALDLAARVGLLAEESDSDPHPVVEPTAAVPAGGAPEAIHAGASSAMMALSVALAVLGARRWSPC
jgi:nitrous oxidase accessory protein